MITLYPSFHSDVWNINPLKTLWHKWTSYAGAYLTIVANNIRHAYLTLLDIKNAWVFFAS